MTSVSLWLKSGNLVLRWSFPEILGMSQYLLQVSQAAMTSQCGSIIRVASQSTYLDLSVPVLGPVNEVLICSRASSVHSRPER